MKKIIIIVYGYNKLDSNNANAICIHNLLAHLKRKYEIELITSTEKKNTYTEVLNNLNIHYLPLKIEKKMKTTLKLWERCVLQYVEKNIKISKKTTLMTISFPFNIQNIGLKIKKKHPNLTWFVYELDPFTYNKILSNYTIKFFYRFIKELTILKNAEKVLLTHELYDQYSNNLFKGLKNKYIDVGIPVMKLDNENMSYKKVNYKPKKFLYVGTFYSNIRNPNYMIGLFIKLFKIKKNLSLDLVGPTKEDIPMKYHKSLNNQILIHGRVSKNKVEEFILEADILVSIGNSVDNQLPSKVLEYIGTGKPIINFYSIEKDTSNKYLSNYPNALLINQNDDIDMNIIKIIDFINTNKFNEISEKIIFDIYRNETIESVATKIINAIN